MNIHYVFICFKWNRKQKRQIEMISNEKRNSLSRTNMIMYVKHNHFKQELHFAEQEKFSQPQIVY